MENPVAYAFQDGVATITMDDGKANAVSSAMQEALNAALEEALADKAVVVLGGRAGTFCAGFHLPTLMAGGPDAVKMLAGGFELARRILTFPRPVVIACSGHALAMGAFLLLSGDFSVGAAGAFKIGANEVAIGLSMPHAAVEICRARLAPAHFLRAMMTSEIYRPEEAVAAGFLDRVVPEAEVLSEARAVAARFTQLNMNAYRETKQRVRAPLLAALNGAMEADQAVFRQLCKVA
ncbi:MAG: crotonase/enoyl-CoA hydratase family protein [Nevskiaceae bacterium]|nr:MAG: crotonase/enoyl-CoA hydratase family protein [Nevskiaceae bacterium]